ncbi:hypothetical protein KFL_011310020 [Klebsormidium nitens]|uniref:Uncharacterized protein n=1 Tax=Klebsormidium nitens TaxID=105231 RepID=A0A1Y1IQ33_KLENI|nr:hypothetical protein KFL_011310020 [Klebsormidium nitens]|eukprot:GAQ92773.1 hypothetical protein KFL_011310020 [Klebsormidium nitens]
MSMAYCAASQAVSPCAVSQITHGCESSQNRPNSVGLSPIPDVQVGLSLFSVSRFQSPKPSRRRDSHVAGATRPTRRRQIRKTEIGPDLNVKEEDTPDKWKKEDYSDGLERPWLDEPGFWEGERWNLLGTFVQWMPLFALIFAALGGAVAVASYNGGAADYKETEEYQAAVQNQKEADELGAESAEAPSVAGD